MSGPHQPGILNHLEIFCNSLLTYLDPFECVEADDGYIGEAPLRVCCPGCVTCPCEKKKMMAFVRSRQETVNKDLNKGAFWFKLIGKILLITMMFLLQFVSSLNWQLEMGNHCLKLSIKIISFT